VSASETIGAREGETVDAAALRSWMLRKLPELLAPDSTVAIRQFPAGFSNLTYLVDIADSGGTRAFVLRRPPRGERTGHAHDVGREYGILNALHPLGVPVPAPIARCDDDSVIGAPFYLMQHVAGTILRARLPERLVADAGGGERTMRALSLSFVNAQARLHAVDVATEPLRSLGRAGGYVERQVQGWTRRWHASRTEEVPDITALAAWLEANRPADSGSVLVHNDFKYDNLVLDESLTSIRAILDWEMATVGDPLMDLGTSLAYWVEAGDPAVMRSLGLGATALPGNATREELVHQYALATGRDVGHAPFYFAFGLFKVAVIAQQIYARHVAGLTADPRFARLGEVVAALGDAGRRASVTGRL
jgi:aminoglycoside phosphotransferase (APT) family kinase protein